MKATSKSGYAADLTTGTVHRVKAMVALRTGNLYTYAARWQCGDVSTDVTAVADPDTHSDLCYRCTEPVVRFVGNRAAWLRLQRRRALVDGLRVAS